MRATRQEIARARVEQAWWRSVGDVLGMQLCGWSGDWSATFVRENGSMFECPGDVATKLLVLSAPLIEPLTDTTKMNIIEKGDGRISEPQKRLAAKQEMEHATESIARRISAERMGTGGLWELFLVEAYEKWFAWRAADSKKEGESR